MQIIEKGIDRIISQQILNKVFVKPYEGYHKHFTSKNSRLINGGFL